MSSAQKQPVQYPSTAFSVALREARERSHLTLDEAGYLVRQKLGRRWGTGKESIRNLEIGRTPIERAEPLLILALADLYNVPVAELLPDNDDLWVSIGDMLRRRGPERGRPRSVATHRELPTRGSSRPKNRRSGPVTPLRRSA